MSAPTDDDAKAPPADDEEKRMRRAIVGPPPHPLGDPRERAEATAPPPETPTIVERLRASPLTALILIVNLGWFLWAEHHGSTNGTAILMRFGAVEPVHVWMGEWWRIASHMILHIGWIHFLWNSYIGFSVCAAVERELGAARFVATYLVAGIVGGCVTVLTLYPPSAGASGAMFGMIGALLALRRRRLGSFAAFAKDPATRSTLMQAGLWLLIGMFVNFNNRAHFGGLVGGAVATFALTSPKARVAFPVVLAGVAGLFVAAIRPTWKPAGEEVVALRSWGAQYLFGFRGFPVDAERGKRFATRACNAGSETACHDLRIFEARGAPPPEGATNDEGRETEP